MSAYRTGYGFRCDACGDMVEYLAHESWTEMPRGENGRPAGICNPCWAKPPTMHVFEAVAEGRLTAEQGAILLTIIRAPKTWWGRLWRIVAGA